MAKKRVLSGRRGFLLSLGTLAGMSALANAVRHRHWNNPVQALADKNRSFTVVENTPLRNRAAAKGLIYGAATQKYMLLQFASVADRGQLLHKEAKWLVRVQR